MTITNLHHHRNATAKAQRAMDAIRRIIDESLIPDHEVPDVTDRRTGYAWFSQELIARNSLPAWQMVGIAHDLATGRRPRGLYEITDFRTSREFLFPMLAAARDDNDPEPTDPFAGLTGDAA